MPFKPTDDFCSEVFIFILRQHLLKIFYLLSGLTGLWKKNDDLNFTDEETKTQLKL